MFRYSKTTIRFLAVAAWAAALPGLIHAQGAYLTQDAYVLLSGPGFTTNYNSAGVMMIHTTARAYLQFTLDQQTGLTSADIAQATLYVYVNTVATGGNIAAMQVLAGTNVPWSETTITGNTQPGSRGPEYPALVTRAGTYVGFDVTQIVKNWKDGAPNYGIALSPAVGQNPVPSIVLDTKESTTTSHPATLDIQLARGGGTAGPQGVQGPQGPAGPQGVKGNTGAQGIQGLTGPAVGVWGDGSAGDLLINTDADWSYSPPSFNLQFTSLTINSGVTLTVPSGLTIRVNGPAVIDGSIIVNPQPSFPFMAGNPQGISSSPAVYSWGGTGLSQIAAAQIVNPGVLGGGSGGTSSTSLNYVMGGGGGGTIVIRARSGILFGGSGSIQANGGNGTSPGRCYNGDGDNGCYSDQNVSGSSRGRSALMRAKSGLPSGGGGAAPASVSPRGNAGCTPQDSASGGLPASSALKPGIRAGGSSGPGGSGGGGGVIVLAAAGSITLASGTLITANGGRGGNGFGCPGDLNVYPGGGGGGGGIIHFLGANDNSNSPAYGSVLQVNGGSLGSTWGTGVPTTDGAGGGASAGDGGDGYNYTSGWYLQTSSGYAGYIIQTLIADPSGLL